MYQTNDVIWVLYGAILVFWMQAGFTMLEAGFTRAKNSGNIIMKNLMDFSLGSLAFWVLGYGIMYGSANGWFGGIDLFICNDYDTGSIGKYTHIIFNTMFCATAATIVSGAMAERTKFSAYLIYSVVISAIIYPVEGHWVWGNGWLSELSIGRWTGFHDYAGSAVVHMTGGIAALIGAKLLGPRIGKYDNNNNPKAIPGHSLTLGALGVFILWMGWFGFNGASSYGMSNDGNVLDVSNVFMTTNIAAATAATTVMFITWKRYGKPDISMTLNGVLAGLVAITAGCSAVDPWAAAVIGIISAFAMTASLELMERVLRIDDPVGAVSVHGVCGLVGSLCVGVFARDGGWLLTGNADRFIVQLIGTFAICIFVTVIMLAVFVTIKACVGLRVSAHEEIVGLDFEEHGLKTAYSDFLSYQFPAQMMEGENNDDDKDFDRIPVTEAVPVSMDTGSGQPDVEINKIDIICQVNKFARLKNALEKIGVTGMTVSNVMGCGTQKGATNLYRGSDQEITMTHKLKVEIVVAKVPVHYVIDTVRKALYTGRIGDGKIFVHTLDEVCRIRTGEINYDALQSVDKL